MWKKEVVEAEDYMYCIFEKYQSTKEWVSIVRLLLSVKSRDIGHIYGVQE